MLKRFRLGARFPVRTIHSTILERKSTLLPIIRLANNLQLPTGPWNDSSKKHILRFRTDDPWSKFIGNEGLAPDACAEEVAPFFMSKDSPEPLGFLRAPVFDALRMSVASVEKAGSIWDIGSSSVRFTNALRDPVQTRSSAIDSLVKQWRAEGRFRDILGKESSNEVYPVYRSKLAFGEELQCTVERSALPLFGFPNYGSMLIAYFTCPDTSRPMIWVSRRSMTKRSFPGMLDVTVGGGIPHGDSPHSAIIREAHEEARLDEAYIRERISDTGMLEYQHRDPDGWILPGVYFTFELEMDPPSFKGSIQPTPHDGEVEYFELMDAERVLDNLLCGKFKGSSAFAMTQFLFRRGYTSHSTANCRR